MFCSVVVITLFQFLSASTSCCRYDYIIVGSGSAGSVLANRLSKDQLNKVLLLEVGEELPLSSRIPAQPFDFLFTPATWNFTYLKNDRYGFGLNDQRILHNSGRALGGSGQINHNLYVRGNRRDYDEWATNGAFGWDWENVFPYFLKSEKNTNLEILNNGFHGAGGDLIVQFPPFHSPITNTFKEAVKLLNYSVDDFNGHHQNVFMPPQGTIRNGRRWSTLQAFIRPVVGRRNLKVITSAFVTKILINKRKQAYGVIFNQTGKIREAFARKEVIVSAGAYNSVKLLMLSGIGPKEELQRLQIPIISDVPVGRNFHNHLSTLLHVFLADTFTYRNDRITKEDYIEILTKGTGILTNLGGVETIGFINSKYNKNPDWPDLEIVWFTSSVASDNGTTLRTASNTNEEVWNYFKPFVSQDTITCLPIVAHPRSRGFITLKSSNPYDDFLIDANFYSDPHDLKVMIEGMKFCLDMSKTEPMKKLNVRPVPTIVPGCEKYEKYSDEYYECMIFTQPFPVHHHAGTCKMGDVKDPSTVVDRKLRVKNVKKLRVVDASVIPSLPSGHTHAIVTMIAEKAADMILRNT